MVWRSVWGHTRSLVADRVYSYWDRSENKSIGKRVGVEKEASRCFRRLLGVERSTNSTSVPMLHSPMYLQLTYRGATLKSFVFACCSVPD
jgi:hypothetical protein